MPTRNKSRPSSVTTADQSLSDKKAIFSKKSEDGPQPTTPKKLSNTLLTLDDTIEKNSDSVEKALLSQSTEGDMHTKLPIKSPQESNESASLDATSVSSVTSTNGSLKTSSPDDENKLLDSKTDTTWKPRTKPTEKTTVDVQQKKQMFDTQMSSSLENSISAPKSSHNASADPKAVPSSIVNKNGTDSSSNIPEDITSDAKMNDNKDDISRPTSCSSSNSTASSYSSVANTPIGFNNDRHFQSADINSPMIHNTNNFQGLDRAETYDQSMDQDTDSSKDLASSAPHVLLENRKIGKLKNPKVQKYIRMHIYTN